MTAAGVLAAAAAAVFVGYLWVSRSGSVLRSAPLTPILVAGVGTPSASHDSRPSVRSARLHAITRKASVDSDDMSTGSLVVTSTPSGARVTVNGIGWGSTPVTINYLPVGPKRVRLSKDGYVAEERAVALTSDQPRRAVRLMLRARRDGTAEAALR